MKVTVCIAAFCHSRKKIVAVSDLKVSFDDFSGDDLVVKTEPISENWHVLSSGDDMDQVPFVIQRARDLVNKSKTNSQRAVAYALQTALTERLHEKIESHVLSLSGHPNPAM